MATYTTLQDLDTAAITDTYGLDRPVFTEIPGGAANSSFKVTCSSASYTLTVLNNHNFTSATRLAHLTRALYANGLPTTTVLPTRTGEFVAEPCGSPTILKPWIDGVVHKKTPFDLLPDAGQLLAHLHHISPELPGLPLRTRRLTPQHEAAISTFADTEFAEWLTTRLSSIRDLRSSHPDSITHGDLFPDNLIIRPDHSLAIIDWETASLDDPLLDLGMTLVGLAEIDGVLDSEYARQIIRGYGKIRPLSSEDLDLLPAMTEHAALIIAFHRYYRHNVRFPNPDQANRYQEIVALVQSLEKLELDP